MNRPSTGRFALQSRRPWKTPTNLPSSHSGVLDGSYSCVLDSPVELGNHHAQAAPRPIKQKLKGGGWDSMFVYVPRSFQCVAILKICLSVGAVPAIHGWFRAEAGRPDAFGKCVVIQEPSH